MGSKRKRKKQNSLKRKKKNLKKGLRTGNELETQVLWCSFSFYSFIVNQSSRGTAAAGYYQKRNNNKEKNKKNSPEGSVKLKLRNLFRENRAQGEKTW